MIFILTLSSGMITVFFISRYRKPAGASCYFYNDVRAFFSFLLFNYHLLLTYFNRSFFCLITSYFDTEKYEGMQLVPREKIIHSYNINPLCNAHRHMMQGY